MDCFQYCMWGRKVHIPKALITEIIRIHQNFSHGQPAAFAELTHSTLHGRWPVGVFFAIVLWVINGISANCFRVLDAAREILSSYCMYKPFFQSIGKLLKVESSPSSIINAMKASIKAISFYNTFQSSHSSTSLLLYIIEITWIR